MTDIWYNRRLTVLPMLLDSDTIPFNRKVSILGSDRSPRCHGVDKGDFKELSRGSSSKWAFILRGMRRSLWGLVMCQEDGTVYNVLCSLASLGLWQSGPRLSGLSCPSSRGNDEQRTQSNSNEGELRATVNRRLFDFNNVQLISIELNTHESEILA